MAITDQVFEPPADPDDIADRLGLTVVQRRDGVLYARDDSHLYALARRKGEPNDGRVWLAEVPETWHQQYPYVGEIHHTPAEAAEHAGLTVIEADPDGKYAVALDGYGRRVRVEYGGNGPTSRWWDWASEDQMNRWRPQHQVVSHRVV